MNDELTTRLSRQLHDQVDDWSAAPLTLERVQGTARSIRRRRQALTTGAVAAAVLAVAIPIGVSLGGSNDSGIAPAPPGPSEVVDSANPETGDGSPLGVAYVEGGVLTLPTGETVDVDRQVTGGAVVSAGTVFVLEGDRLVQLDAEGGTVDTTPIAEGGIATGPDQTAIAYVRAADGELVVEDGAGTITELGVHPGLSEVVAVSGTTVWFRYGAGGWDVASAQAAPELPEAEWVTDVAPDGRLAVVASVNDMLEACSAVVQGGVSTLESCDYVYGRFAPDGEHLSAHPNYLSGIGDPFVAILDSRGGEVARFETDRNGYIRTSTWEDPSHLLVTTYDADSGWSVVRLGVDGTSEVALGPSQDGDDVSPSFLVLGSAS